jgi:hypothetical protein
MIQGLADLFDWRGPFFLYGYGICQANATKWMLRESKAVVRVRPDPAGDDRRLCGGRTAIASAVIGDRPPSLPGISNIPRNPQDSIRHACYKSKAHSCWRCEPSIAVA